MEVGDGKRRILVVDDDPDLGELVVAGLEAMDFEVVFHTSAEVGFADLVERDYQAVLTDLNMPGMNGLEFCERVAANRPDVPVVVMTAFASLETAVQAIRVGADDYVTKPLQLDALALRLERVIGNRSLSAEVRRLRDVVDRTTHFEDILGDSRPMQAMYDLLDRIASSDASVLVTGESGTGKELIARSLHQRSQRSSGPFVAINCSAVPEQLLESELFGHAKGAFTDASNDREGLFARANGGTLFLDEIGDMPTSVQPKLLRALQERTIRPVGSDSETAIDVRVVAATNRDLESAVNDDEFREDLYFRINVIHVEVPPLRARGRDVLVLAQHFLASFAGRANKPVRAISASAAEKLLSYGWPGNVRELQNCMERAVALTRFEEITVEDLPDKIRNYKRTHVYVASADPSELVPMEAVERSYITRVMEATNANKTLAAKILGFDRKTLYRKLERYGIDVQPREAT